MQKVQIYDAIMGSGKTNDAIDRMKGYLKNGIKFIYITPFLDEIARVTNELSSDEVFSPLGREDNNGKSIYEVSEELIYKNGNFKGEKSYKKLNKRAQFLKMASQGKNIISTHSLFMSLKREDFNLFSDYILILDEVVNPLDVEYIGAKDIEILKNQNLIIIDENTNAVRFIDEEYRDSAFRKIKEMCYNSSVFHLDKYFFVWVFPIEIFKEFKEVQVLTYFFEGSLLAAYFKMNNIQYDLNKKSSKQQLLNLKQLLNIYTGDANQTRSRGLVTGEYCKSKLEDTTDTKLKSIKNSTEYIFKKVFKTKSNENAFTTFKSIRKKLSGDGYARGFIPINARATNDFKHKESMAYLGNRYFDPQTKHFFEMRGIELNQDLWALSELIQWVWRGCIRDSKKMNLYIPSYRMRGLITDWLDGKFLSNVTAKTSTSKLKKSA